jgi:NTP pyrophosphatase (non-canonical NTP hydrolase)
MQQKVREFQQRHGLVSSPDVALLDLLSELGEVSKVLLKATDYGRHPFRRDAAADLDGELGDVLYSLASLANATGCDLASALDLALAKYERRLHEKGHAGSGGSA